MIAGIVATEIFLPILSIKKSSLPSSMWTAISDAPNYSSYLNGFRTRILSAPCGGKQVNQVRIGCSRLLHIIRCTPLFHTASSSTDAPAFVRAHGIRDSADQSWTFRAGTC